MIHEIVRAAENVASKYDLNFRIKYDFKKYAKYVTVELYNDYNMHVAHIFDIFDLEMLNNAYLELASERINSTLEEMATDLHTRLKEN